MLLGKLREDVRLLERLALFEGLENVAIGTSVTPESLCLALLRCLHSEDLGAAKHQFQELASALGVQPDSDQLEPFRTILHLKLWGGSQEDKHQLQQYLIRQLRLNFEAELHAPAPSPPPATTQLSVAAADSILAPALNVSTLPHSINPSQYSTTAFLQLVKQGNLPHSTPLIHQFDPSQLLEAIAHDSIPAPQQVELLRRGLVPPAALSGDVLVKVVQQWLDNDSKTTWDCRDAFDWVTNSWDQFTAEQAERIRTMLPGPAYGCDPVVDRPYITALVIKALAGPEAACAADSISSRLLAPWSSGAGLAAATVDLQRILRVCDQLGPAAEWVRFHAVHAQLVLQQEHQSAVDISLLISYLKMLGRVTWCPGPTITDNELGIQQQQQRTYVACSVCGTLPIVGPRFRSLSQFGFNCCAACLGSQQAVNASPMEQVKVQDLIHITPEVPLPPLLGSIPRSEPCNYKEARSMLLEVVQMDGAAGAPEQFTLEGPCPLAAAGLLLPKEWRDQAVAEAKLLSKRGDTAAWARLYQRSGGSVERLQSTVELAFAPHNTDSYTLQEDVVLRLDTKNVGHQQVLVKLYEINCWNYYISEGAEVDLNLELSGLAPSKTICINTPQNPIIRCRHSIPLGLGGVAGVWLVEAVAGSTRVRARICKGSLHITQRPSVAGQVITVMDEQWRPVKGVRMWCDNQEFKSKPESPHEVLLPYARATETISLVVSASVVDPSAAEAAATAAAQGSDKDQECVVLFPSFERLKEHYRSRGQLYCHQETLLPEQTVPLLLQLALQVHGMSAPLQLLQEAKLRVTTATQDGAEVTQVFKDLTVHPVTGQLQLQYNLPPAARRLSAVLTTKICLAQPGVNGEPDYQEFELRQLLPGLSGPVASVDIQAAAAGPAIWDVYLSAQGITTSNNSSSSEPEYILQVLGRAGEAPAVPKVLSVWLSHVHFSPRLKVHLRVETGAYGVVKLGPLTGIRHIEAQIEGSVDCVELLPAASTAAPVTGACGVLRQWQIAQASWWQGGLQAQYNVPAGGDLVIPLTAPSGQNLHATLLQVVESAKSGSHNRGKETAAVAADVSSQHVSIIPAAADGVGSSASASQLTLLGSSRTTVIKIHGLAPGAYRLLVPALLLEPPEEGYVGPGWRGAGSSGSTAMAVHIKVLPAVEVVGGESAAAALDVDAAGEAAAEPATPVGTADSPSWLWVGGDGGDGCTADNEVVQPSPAAQLHVMSCSCSTDSGLSIQVTGTPDQVQSAQVVAVLHRFLPGGFGYAAHMLHNNVAGDADDEDDTGAGYGFNEGLASQLSHVHGTGGFGSGLSLQQQPCGGLRSCAYSRAAKLDSAVAYVLQRRQWEENARRAGGLRPGSLLDRPSLLVVPRCVRSAASATSVLRGGDGERVNEVQRKMKKAARRSAPRYGPPSIPCPVQECDYAYESSRGPQAQACMMMMPTDFSPMQGYPMNGPTTPVLSHLQNPAVVLTSLKVDSQGLVYIPPQQLQQMVSAAVQQAGARAAAPSSSVVDYLSGYSCVYIAAYVLRQPGQFSSARCVVQHAIPAEQLSEAVIPRDLDFMRDVQQDSVLALSCEVLALAPGASITLPSSAAEAEAAVYSSTAQLYQLLSGLLELSEASWGLSGEREGGSSRYSRLGSAAAGAGGPAGALIAGVSDLGAIRALLPRPRPPVQADGVRPSMLLRQWEPLLLSWPQLSGPARLELLDKINSAELAFYLSCRDPTAYQQLILPLLRLKLTSELCCLEQVLLLQAAHGQPPLPKPQTPSTSYDPAYKAAKEQLLQLWYAPHRYQHLTALERVLLAALEGCEALLLLCKDMRSILETPEQKRGMKKTWMSPARRALFDFALLVFKNMQQQELQQNQQRVQGGADEDAGDPGAATEGTESDDFVHVTFDGGVQQRQLEAASFMHMPGAPPPPPAPSAAAYSAMPVSMGRAAVDELDLSARQAVAAAASRSARLAPTDTKEWCEAGWWKWDGRQAPPDIIPVSYFWADFAEHLAAHPDQPFLPTDPTGAAASTASVVAALAVVGLEADELSTTAAAAGGGGDGGGRTGCSKTHDGSTVALTARSPCVVWVKQAKAIASITASCSTAGTSAGETSIRRGPGGTVVVQGGAASVLVSERLYDPRFSSTSDPETGEQLLLALQPTEQLPLVTGQRYCQDVIITNTGATEQQLDILAQIPQGAMPLSDQPYTHTVSVTLAPYTTYTQNMIFYFPLPGVYKRAAASISKRGRPAWLPRTPHSPLHVVGRPPAATALPDSQHERRLGESFNWADFMRTASTQQMIEYLQSGDLSVAAIEDLSPHCKDYTFFTAAVAALAKRHVYSQHIWKWAVAHMDGPALQQLLLMSTLARSFFDKSVPASHLALLPLNERDLGVQHLEYWPWVNPYCRPIPRDDGGDSNLPSVLADNPNITEQWKAFLMATLLDFSSSSSSRITSSQSSNSLSLARVTAAAGYLLLQDRVDDADMLLNSFDLEAAAAALQEEAPLRMQVDYLRTWMALCRPLPPAADNNSHVQSALMLGKSVVERYRDCGLLLPWRKRFSQLSSLVNELEQQMAGTVRTSLAAAGARPDEAPPEDAGVMLSVVSCEAGQLKIQFRGLSEVQLAAYQIDTELLFTTQPFSCFSNSNSSSSSAGAGARPAVNDGAHTGLGKVAYVQPKARLKLPLSEQQAHDIAGVSSQPPAAAVLPVGALPGTAIFDVDELLPELQSQSVLLEVSGGGASGTVPRFASKLVVHVTESHGLLQAFHKSLNKDSSGSSCQALHPAAAVYVKVFAQDKSGQEWFYKDGYTDVRGKFDYVTLTSTTDMSCVSRFSLLVASQELGAVIHQAAPPPR